MSVISDRLSASRDALTVNGTAFKQVTGTTAVVVRTGVSVLQGICVNTATTAGTVSIADTTGTETGTPIGILSAATPAGTYLLPTDCATGIRVTLSEAADNVTVYYTAG